MTLLHVLAMYSITITVITASLEFIINQIRKLFLWEIIVPCSKYTKYSSLCCEESLPTTVEEQDASIILVFIKTVPNSSFLSILRCG